MSEKWLPVVGYEGLSEESIERAALGIHASHDRGDWDEELPVVQGEYLDMARAGLARLMEGESNE